MEFFYEPTVKNLVWSELNSQNNTIHSEVTLNGGKRIDLVEERQSDFLGYELKVKDESLMGPEHKFSQDVMIQLSNYIQSGNLDFLYLVSTSRPLLYLINDYIKGRDPFKNLTDPDLSNDPAYEYLSENLKRKFGPTIRAENFGPLLGNIGLIHADIQEGEASLHYLRKAERLPRRSIPNIRKTEEFYRHAIFEYCKGKEDFVLCEGVIPKILGNGCLERIDVFAITGEALKKPYNIRLRQNEMLKHGNDYATHYVAIEVKGHYPTSRDIDQIERYLTTKTYTEFYVGLPLKDANKFSAFLSQGTLDEVEDNLINGVGILGVDSNGKTHLIKMSKRFEMVYDSIGARSLGLHGNYYDKLYSIGTGQLVNNQDELDKYNPYPCEYDSPIRKVIKSRSGRMEHYL